MQLCLLQRRPGVRKLRADDARAALLQVRMELRDAARVPAPPRDSGPSSCPRNVSWAHSRPLESGVYCLWKITMENMLEVLTLLVGSRSNLSNLLGAESRAQVPARKPRGGGGGGGEYRAAYGDGVC